MVSDSIYLFQIEWTLEQLYQNKRSWIHSLSPLFLPFKILKISLVRLHLLKRMLALDPKINTIFNQIKAKLIISSVMQALG